MGDFSSPLYIDNYIKVITRILEDQMKTDKIFLLGGGVKMKKGHILLTKREIEVLQLLSKGTKNSFIAQKLFISPHTVEVHKSNIVKKLNLKNAAELFCYAALNKDKIKCF